MINILGNRNSLVDQFIGELRNVEIHTDRLRFRRNLERLGEIFAYEISKTLEWKNKDITTPLGVASVPNLVEQPVLGTILRAGLPMHNGMLNYFDGAENSFISAYRRHHKDGTFDVHVEYLACPSLQDRTLILCDPMLATGTSLVLSYKAMIHRGIPRHTHIVALIASAEAVNYVKMHMPSNITIWIGAVDEELTAQSYIVPGLGDAGDLAFGDKI